MTPSFLQTYAEPHIASRAGQVIMAAAAAGAGVLALRAILPRRHPSRALFLSAAQNGVGYLVLGIGCRFVIQHHRSRLQMAVLLAAVAGVEALRYRRRGAGPVRAASWIAGSAAVCLGVLAAKWALEPGALTDAFSRLTLPREAA